MGTPPFYHSEHAYKCLQTPNVGHIGGHLPLSCKHRHMLRKGAPPNKLYRLLHMGF